MPVPEPDVAAIVARTARSYDALPYASDPFPFTHPAQVGAVARLFGLEAAAPGEARILELGCASCLAYGFKPGMTADALYEWYKMAGDDPFVRPGVGFSAWDYAKWRCSELAGPADPAYSPISFEEFLRRRAAEAPGGHKLYEARREAPEEAKPALLEKEKEFWKGVHSRLDPSWRTVIEEAQKKREARQPPPTSPPEPLKAPRPDIIDFVAARVRQRRAEAPPPGTQYELPFDQ